MFGTGSVPQYKYKGKTKRGVFGQIHSYVQKGEEECDVKLVCVRARVP
jgi:hypothetical protein